REQLDIEEDNKINFIDYGDYKKTVSSYVRSKNEIAVIVASGDIVPGAGEPDESIGSTTFAKALRKARKNDKVKAIVIRINSPGGSFMASDVMWREIMLAKEEKPVIASMSNYAASGGYYLAMACDTIVAQPNTITGSIGIFSVIFNMSEFFEDKLGITHDQVNTGRLSDMLTVTRPLTPEEKSIFQNGADEGYETFTSKAAEGRGMSVADLKKVASGRVWTGTQALERGLVDVIGDYQDALTIAAEKADIADDYKLRYYPKQETLLEKIFEDPQAQASATMGKQELGEYYFYLKQLQKIKSYAGVQARMPYELQIK
ncbi:MAG: signal peptide peptidase SppA, partial [Bacteroidota bacterium]